MATFYRIDLDAPTFGAVFQNCPKLLARKTINFHNIQRAQTCATPTYHAHRPPPT